MSNEALIMARLQLRYWQEQCEVAQKAGDAELLAQSKLYLQDAQAEVAALEPPEDGETSDNRSINLFDEADIRAYCAEFAVTEEDLTAAVDAVGVRVSDVKQYLLRRDMRRSFSRL
jgi:hypothetical protein